MDPSVALGLWCLGTAGHFLLTARWVARAGSGLTLDEHWFRTILIGTATLSIVLHLFASSVGLGLIRVLLTLAAGHAAAAWTFGVTEPWHANERAEPADSVTRVLELAAALLLVAIVAQWIALAVPTLEVSGTDAAHYHVPNAVNLALGASLFDLPPTPHLYPMGTSVLAAWFLLPLHTPLLNDLVMVLPFLLLLAAGAWIFRLLTSLSGLAWTTGAALALFSTKLFRFAGLMSADLPFAASSLAFAAAALAPIVRRRLTAIDVWLIALSAGLLLGTKVTGVVVAVLFGGPACLALAVRHARARRTAPPAAGRVTPLVLAGALAAMVGAGGIWLVRNWWVWNSPVAPNGVSLFGITLFPGAAYEATTYNSVLGDLAATSNYDLAARTTLYINEWLGAWYLLLLGCMLLVPIDAAVAWWRGTSPALVRARAGAFIVATGTAVFISWFLIGAPWTSLEWTRGLSLRYALPWFVLLPLVAWLGLFPVAVPWYRHPALRALGAIVLAGGGVAIFSAHEPPPFPPFPTLTAFLAALAVWAVVHLAARGTRGALVAVMAVLVAASAGFGLLAAKADVHARGELAAAMATSPRNEEEQVYDAALASEGRDRVTCSGRRFFITTRFNLPLALQGVRLANGVYYAGRDLSVTSRVRPAMGPCDYIVTDEAVLGTTKGANLHAALAGSSATLTRAATLGAFVLLVNR